MAQLEVTKFQTGAVRDKTAVPVRWDLISCVALDSIVEINVPPPPEPTYSWLNYVGEATRHLLVFIGGHRQQPHLELAWWALSDAVDLKELTQGDFRERRAMRQDVTIQDHNYAALSYQALKHLASTLEEGRGKYGEWNWLYGFPIQSTISHALDHMWAITNADSSEDHWGHAFCNLMFAIHTSRMREDLCIGLLGDWFQLTGEIKKNLDEHRLERERHEQLGREPMANAGRVNAGRIDTGRIDDGYVQGGDSRVASRIGTAANQEWGSHPQHADAVSAVANSGQFNRAVETARGGPAPIPRQGFA